ncbi:Putative protein [Zobellia galactanivorans]|uniref:Uncharacterized protein n=1 Tax=Zobellia galactanivorans (strain DSM 12802 / CCUG 47099 / CIP 106680 / NCIMB 13871 / Dsij) TaxID=63186 RepID=G0LBE8_ZOBGA|nr:Putative protein [Zobellia galactanivorans]
MTLTDKTICQSLYERTKLMKISDSAQNFSTPVINIL